MILLFAYYLKNDKKYFHKPMLQTCEQMQNNKLHEQNRIIMKKGLVVIEKTEDHCEMLFYYEGSCMIPLRRRDDI